MAITTPIEWCDSVLNLQMGCSGCELWNRKANIKHCYAGTLTDRYGGRKGYPETFEQPALFLERLDAALRWPDLRGKDRPDKPWLNGRPRMIFLNDMGDTFTEGLPLDWLMTPCGKANRPALDQMAESPHVYMMLTKRPSRMAEFSRSQRLPNNFWPGTSITSEKTLPRIENLSRVVGGGIRWLSVEPLLNLIKLPTINSHSRGSVQQMRAWSSSGKEGRALEVDFVIIGGESGPGARECRIEWIRSVLYQCRQAGTPAFLKQAGANVRWAPASGPCGLWPDHVRVNYESRGEHSVHRFILRDKKGGDPSEWPEELRVRQYPEFSV